jgi:hypothetical protein
MKLNAFRYSKPINLLRSRSLVAPLMWLRPLQGTTQQGPLVHPMPSGPPNIEPSHSPRRAFVLAARVTSNPQKEGSRFLQRRTVERWASQQLSWSSVPLRRLSPSESTQPRFTSPGTFRPQSFSLSRRISPRSDARPCFMPVTPMGFSPSGVFPHNQVCQLLTDRLPS